MYMIDWYDRNQCHHGNVEAHDRSNGRVFKVSYGDARPAAVDIARLSDGELVNLLLTRNDWFCPPRAARDSRARPERCRRPREPD